MADQIGCGHAIIRDKAISCSLPSNPSKWDVFGIVVNQVLHRQHGDSVMEEVGLPAKKLTYVFGQQCVYDLGVGFHR